MEERIIELELRSMAQQQTLEELSEVVYRQQRELDGLRAALEAVAKKLPEPGLVDAKQHDKPPHY